MTVKTSLVFSTALSDAFNHAWKYLIENHTDKTIRHLNESVFRYLVIQHLSHYNQDIGIDDEWKRIDLLLRDNLCQAAIEFKFYDSRPLRALSGATTYKGGSGKANYKEFEKSLKILVNLNSQSWYKEQNANITERYFILTGTKHLNSSPRRDFFSWYYPATKINSDFCELEIIDQNRESLGAIQIFGWLCHVKKHSQKKIKNRHYMKN